MAVTKKTKTDRFKVSLDLIAQMEKLAPGCYSEQDGGDWYLLAPSHQRLAEDFGKRDDARKMAIALATDQLPEGWSIVRNNSMFMTIDVGQGFEATVWVSECKKHFGRMPFQGSIG